MFEVLGAQLHNWYLTYRAMARRIYRKIHLQDKTKEAFRKHFDDFMEKVKMGDIELVEQDFNALISDMYKLYQADFDVEKMDVLFCHNLGEGVKNEKQLADQAQKSVVHLNIQYDAFPVKVKGVGEIKDKDHLVQLLKKKFNEFTKELKAIHEKSLAESEKLFKQELDQHRQWERMRDKVYDNFSHYDEEQFARVLRWFYKSGEKGMDKVMDDEKQVIRSTSQKITSPEDIRKIFGMIDDAISQLKTQEKEIMKLYNAISYINLVAVHMFFVYKQMYEDGTVQKALQMLKQQKYPSDKLSQFESKLKELDSWISNETRYVELEAQRSYGSKK